MWFLYKQRSGHHNKEEASAPQQGTHTSSAGAAELHLGVWAPRELMVG